MKTTHKYIVLAALAMTFAACTQEDDFASQGDADAVKITANIGKLQTRVSYDDTTGDTSFGEGDQIRVINHTRSGKSKSDAVYQLSSTSSWSPATDDYVVWDGTESNTFYGVYPATAEYDEFTIPTDQGTDITVADWMTDDYSGSKSADSSVELNFQHLLTKVTVKITQWNSEYTNAEKEITEPAIYSKGKTISISYDTGTDGDNVYTSEGTLTAISPMVSDETFTAIVAPAKYDASDTFMTLTVDGQPLKVFANSSRLKGDGLHPGKHYTFNLTVGKNAVNINSVSVTDWSGKDIDGGVAEEATE